MPRREPPVTLLALAAVLGCSSEPAPAPSAKPAPAPAAAAAPPTQPRPRAPAAPRDAPIATRPATGRPPSVTDAQVATADRVVAWLHDFSDTVARSGPSCHAAAIVVTTSVRTFDPLAKDLGNLVRALESDPAASEWFESRYALQVSVALLPLQKLSTVCANDKELHAAIDAAAHHVEHAMGPLPVYLK